MTMTVSEWPAQGLVCTEHQNGQLLQCSMMGLLSMFDLQYCNIKWQLTMSRRLAVLLSKGVLCHSMIQDNAMM
jgi:hypothetical protein